MGQNRKSHRPDKDPRLAGEGCARLAHGWLRPSLGTRDRHQRQRSRRLRNVFFYLNGANADRLLGRPRETRAQEVVDQFRKDMPDLFDEVVTVQDFAWSEQPWIRGSFGGPPVGGAWMIDEWTKPAGRIHFAGDFTTMKSGWVEGAIESGLRAARQIDPAAKPEAEPGLRQEITRLITNSTSIFIDFQNRPRF